ncbi:hypothetical protein MACK_003901 [Theileria orientalis]|uniref:Uncharacterized protein n=1 Tax=Theileria orientalis TaxID=68886 RepID=A0A976SJ38_THEOR|nr:hypothetical protein MACK_003901 [Theileria orientalis]
MKIYRISKYILVYLLARGHWNIVLPVRTDLNGTATTQAENVKKTPFELDIKKNSATNEFDHKKNGNVVTFTAKDNYAFNAVKQDNKEIWKTNKVSEYATKVVLHGKGKKEKIVAITLLNGTKKSYKKDGKGKPWNEYTGPLPSSGNAKSSNSSYADGVTGGYSRDYTPGATLFTDG